MYERIKDEIVHYNIDRETAKISVLSFDKVDKYEQYGLLIKAD